jgi:hypothetical protein
MNGFRGFIPRFTILAKTAWEYEEAPIPSASTCFRHLVLPVYRSREELERKIGILVGVGDVGFHIL